MCRRRWYGSSHDGATSSPRAVIRRRFRKAPSPSRRRRSCGPDSSNRTRCLTTPSSTRSSTTTSSATWVARRCSPPGMSAKWSSASSALSTPPSTNAVSTHRDQRSPCAHSGATADCRSRAAGGKAPTIHATIDAARRRRTALRGREVGMTETPSDANDGGVSPYGSPRSDEVIRRIRIPHLHAKKERGERWAMLTAYDQYAAAVFDEIGIPVLLVGDSAANNVYAYDTTLPVTVEELLPLVRAVTRSTRRALVVADLPFGSYQVSPGQALETSVRFMKEGDAHAVKLEGGARVAAQVEAIVDAGVPVMAHIGFTPQSEHGLGGYRVQGRGDAAQRLLDDALVLQEAGAFAVVLEMVPTSVAQRVTKELHIPTIGIGAGPHCDAQVLVWQDMAGLNAGPKPRFVKRYADLRSALGAAAKEFAAEVRNGTYPAPEHSFD